MSSNKPKPTLMYDKLYRRAVQEDFTFRMWESCFRNVPVYDMTSVRNVIETINSNGMPKRMPHERMWIEWLQDDFRAGVLVMSMDAANVKASLAMPESCEKFFCVVYISSGISHKLPGDDICVYADPLIIGLDHDTNMSYVEMPVLPPESKPSYVSVMSFRGRCIPCDLSTLKSLKDRADVGLELATPLISGITLLGCRNIVTESVPQSGTHRKLRKGVEDRPWATYKVLKLEMPNRIVQRQPSEPGVDEDDDGGPKVRFHLCRGHFKNLTHARYKNARGLHWWPAHWKGSIELGRADKRYQPVISDDR